MKELIPISEHNGQKAVSARLLHEFLESKQDFSTWIKNRIEKYGLVENQDYEVFRKIVENLSGGRPTIEYALTIDAAKELSMVEGNDKGRQARRYFIECEKIAKENTKPLSQIEILIQSSKILLEHENRLIQVEKENESIKKSVAQIQDGREQALFELNYLPLSNDQIPELDIRRAINSIVGKYQSATQLGYTEIWNGIYSQLYHNYRVSIRGCKKNKSESWLDVAERKGHLEKIYTIVSQLAKSIKR